MMDMPLNTSLGARLRQLRTGWGVTQKQLSTAIGVSGALLSSWENGQAVPPVERLEAYASYFSTRRTIESANPGLLTIDQLTDDEQLARGDLLRNLEGLRLEAATVGSFSRNESGALGGRFWYFPDGQPVTIFCTPLSKRQILGPDHVSDGLSSIMTPAQQYALNTAHPNFIRNFNNGDIDALVELNGHIRAENPGIDVQWTTYDRFLGADAMTGHVIILGGGDALAPLRVGETPGPVESLIRQLDIPITFGEIPDETLDEEFRLRFALSVDDDGQPDTSGKKIQYFEPPFRRDATRLDQRIVIGGAPLLDSDVALILRSENPYNTSATVTLCSGLFSRGTYGAVRAFTDANLRARNTQYLASKGVEKDFWMLFKVPIAGDRTITPDLAGGAHRLKESF